MSVEMARLSRSEKVMLVISARQIWQAVSCLVAIATTSAFRASTDFATAVMQNNDQYSKPTLVSHSFPTSVQSTGRRAKRVVTLFVNHQHHKVGSKQWLVTAKTLDLKSQQEESDHS